MIGIALIKQFLSKKQLMPNSRHELLKNLLYFFISTF